MVTSVSPDTCTGTELLEVFPFPSEPEPPWPQAHTVPSPRKAYTVDLRAEMAVTSVKPVTCTGRELLVVPPLPNSPE